MGQGLLLGLLLGLPHLQHGYAATRHLSDDTFESLHGRWHLSETLKPTAVQTDGAQSHLGEVVFCCFFMFFFRENLPRNFSETMLQKAGGNSGFFMCVETKMMVETNQKTSENHAIVYLWPGLELIKIPRDILGIAVIGFKVPAFLDLGSFCCSFHVGRYVLVTASDHGNQVVFGYLDG